MPHPQPPIARRDAGSDPYAWLEERDAPEVLDYLKAENAYLDSELADQAGRRIERGEGDTGDGGG